VGQYYKIVNLDKKQYITFSVFGNGPKFHEFAHSEAGMMTALAVLLVDGHKGGSGDLCTKSAVAGSWAGDRIVVAGDYAEPDRFGFKSTLYDCDDNPEFVNISEPVMLAMLKDDYILETLQERFTGPNWWNKSWREELEQGFPQVADRLKSAGEQPA
jgi:hypothetical protein